MQKTTIKKIKLAANIVGALLAIAVTVKEFRELNDIEKHLG